MRSKEELLRRWVEALRSGEYTQTTGRLRDMDGHCCLGVLCDVSGRGRWEGESYVTDIAAYLIPYDVADAAGIDADRQDDLARFNDSGGLTFAQIADEIEKWHPEVFGAPVNA